MGDYDFNNTTYVRYTNIVYNIDSVIEKIKKSKNPDEIKQIILYQHDIIFTRDNLVNNNIDKIKELFMDINFLTILDNISGLLAVKLSEIEFIFINKIIYDFFVYSNSINNKEITEIKSKMHSIAYNINRGIILGFIPIMGVNEAIKLSIISRSSFKYENIVHRVNMFIYDSSYDQNNISRIYRIIHGNCVFGCELVDAIGERKFASLFAYTMLEYAKEDADEHFMIQFNRVSNLIMHMLKDLRYDHLESVLLNYVNIVTLYNTPEYKLRFSIKKHISMYEPIYNFIDSIEKKHNIYVY